MKYFYNKKIIGCLILLAALFFCISASAEIIDSGTCGDEGDGSNLTWTLDINGTLIISGTGIMKDYDVTVPWSQDIKSAEICDGVTNIGACAFYNCSGLTKVTIPESVTRLGDEAFSHCTSLESITIPDNVTSIGWDAFDCCPAIRYASLASDTAKALSRNDYSFRVSGTNYDLEYLFNNDKEPDLAVISADKDCAAVILPDGVTTIGYNAFYNCSSLKSITIPASVTSIERYAFQNCSSLESITIPDGVTSIEETSFYDCPAIRYASIGSEAARALSKNDYSFRISDTQYDLIYTFKNNNETGLVLTSVDNDCTELSLPGYITGIEDSAFSGSSSITSITMNETITKINFSSLFSKCIKLEAINYPSGNSTYCSKNGIVFSKDKKSIIYCPKGKTGKYTIPGTVKSLKNNVFTNCTALTGIDIPISVTSIEDAVFEGCTGLISVKAAARTDSIKFSSVFSGCTSLTSITIPKNHHTYCSDDGVVLSKDKKTVIYCPKGKAGSYAIPKGADTIELSAFSDCTALTEVIIPEGVHIIGGLAFSGSTGLKKIKFPDSLTYINWSAFKDCTSLGSIIIPPHVSYIGDNAFMGCKSMKSVTIYDSVTYIGSNAFEKRTQIKAPKDSYAAKWAYEHYYKIKYIDPVYLIYIYNHGNGTATASPSYGPKGTVVTLYVAPNPGYQFREWWVTSGDVTINNNQFTIGSSDIDIIAYFEPSSEKVSITNAKVSIRDQVYTGKAIKPTVTVKLDGQKLTKGTDYKVSYKSNKAIGKATVTVTGTGNYTGTVKATFNIIPKKVTLSSVKAGKKQLTVKWKKSTGITGYEIQYSLKKNFKSAKTVTIKKAATVSKVIKTLTKGKTYYVRVRAYKTVKGKQYYSAWSKTLKAKVK